MKYALKQQGKGLIVFLAGSVVALVAIAVMLFILNSNSGKSFKEPELANRSQSPQADVLTPSNVASVPALISSDAGGLDENLPVEDDELSLFLEQQKVLPSVVASRPVDETVNHSEPVMPLEVKPTAQQILDSGSLEKAKEVARLEAEKKQRERKQEVVTKAPSSSDLAKQSKTVSIQAGAFSDKKLAEEQRAQLALIGVQTQIVTVQFKGQTMYRVQTEQLSNEQVQQVERVLQENGIQIYKR